MSFPLLSQSSSTLPAYSVGEFFFSLRIASQGTLTVDILRVARWKQIAAVFAAGQIFTGPMGILSGERGGTDGQGCVWKKKRKWFGNANDEGPVWQICNRSVRMWKLQKGSCRLLQIFGPSSLIPAWFGFACSVVPGCWSSVNYSAVLPLVEQMCLIAGLHPCIFKSSTVCLIYFFLRWHGNYCFANRIYWKWQEKVSAWFSARVNVAPPHHFIIFFFP